MEVRIDPIPITYSLYTGIGSIQSLRLIILVLPCSNINRILNDQSLVVSMKDGSNKGPYQIDIIYQGPR